MVAFIRRRDDDVMVRFMKTEKKKMSVCRLLLHLLLLPLDNKFTRDREYFWWMQMLRFSSSDLSTHRQHAMQQLLESSGRTMDHLQMKSFCLDWTTASLLSSTRRGLGWALSHNLPSSEDGSMQLLNFLNSSSSVLPKDSIKTLLYSVQDRKAAF